MDLADFIEANIKTLVDDWAAADTVSEKFRRQNFMRLVGCGGRVVATLVRRRTPLHSAQPVIRAGVLRCPPRSKSRLSVRLYSQKIQLLI